MPVAVAKKSDIHKVVVVGMAEASTGGMKVLTAMVNYRGREK